MNATNSIFNSAITYPAIFLPQPTKKVVVKQQINEGKVKPFFLAPKKQDEKSTIKFLKDNFGILKGGVSTFKTEFISCNSLTNYYGSKLSLQLTQDGTIHLELSSSKGIFVINCWDIDSIVKTMNQKNIGLKITKDSVVYYLLKGQLKVKFNVSHLKDHGTYWKLKI
jgi:hypothetical protein